MYDEGQEQGLQCLKDAMRRPSCVQGQYEIIEFYIHHKLIIYFNENGNIYT